MKSKLWFRRKTYGWGWTPITWEGWLVTAIAIAIPFLVKFLANYVGADRDAQHFYTYATVPVIFMGLTLICFRYGEKPKWQWGVKKTKFSHIDLSVSDYKKSVLFYDLILLSLGWEKITSRTDHTTYSDGTLKIIICPVDEAYKEFGYHRKRIGLNHLALYAETKEMVDDFYKEVLQKNNIPTLYDPGATGDNHYYSLFVEDPDRMKLEIVYSPFYCEKEFPFNNLENDFDPYQS